MGTLQNHNTQIPTTVGDKRTVNPSTNHVGNVSKHHHDDVQSGGPSSKGTTGNNPDGTLDTPRSPAI